MSDIAFNATLPNDGDVDVSPETDVVFAIFAPSGLDLVNLRVLVGSDVAYENGAFKRPAYGGSVQSPSANYATVRVTPRRRFSYGRTASAAVYVCSGAFPFPAYTTKTVKFYVRGQPGSVADASLRSTALDVPFPNLPAAEVLRRVLLGTLKGPSSPSFTLSLCYRLSMCSLRSLAYLMPFASVAFEDVSSARAADVGATDAAASALVQVQPLWQPVLAELRNSGADPGALDLIARAQASPYPGEIVGAACAAVLLTAQGVVGFPAPGPTPP